MRLKKGPPDFILFITTLTLLGIGLVMVFSSSAVTAGVRYDEQDLENLRKFLYMLNDHT